MTKFLKKFADEEFGNAVLDWAVLGFGALMLTTAVVLSVVDPGQDVAQEVDPRFEIQSYEADQLRLS